MMYIARMPCHAVFQEYFYFNINYMYLVWKHTENNIFFQFLVPAYVVVLQENVAFIMQSTQFEYK